ncbi:hypothetical protein ACKE5C_02005 [Aneurinibacillus thermoaerophilus]|uniref:Uncharacterized protein n=1 Tax=Aneurinibacillus thermoaerophilus TaxID=143495 RepID=A0ABX8YCN8_ANETH|nr:MULTISPECIES: hypothetical protein [Aneurinibacillus]AMA74312.1 hypothetical protein ACH33_16845 [Aneurinibacillus sp. XH2]QYY43105.1 hypothetical protein K3F53_01985 [Aneurinibacillus thermoaerophilus]
MSDIERQLQFYLRNKKKKVIPMTYKEFDKNIDTIISILGDNKALAIFSDKEVTLYFAKASNVGFVIKSRKFLEKENFPKLDLTVKGAKQPITFFSFILEEIKIHWIALLLILFLIGPFMLIQDNKDFIKELNAALISASAILIGVFLVFITFFYLGREHDVKYFSEGRFYIHFKNDKFIISSSFTSILLSILAIGISFYHYTPTAAISPIIKNSIIKAYGIILSWPYQNVAAGLATLLSIIFFWISFQAMVGYYFQRIKNGINVGTVEKIHKEFFSDKNNNQE